MLDIAEERSGEVTIVGINGRVDTRSARPFQDKLTGLFKDGRSRVMVDCRNVNYISSAGCRALLVACQAAERSAAKLALCNLSTEMRHVFELAGLIEHFAIYPSREEGIAKLA
jgi:anti-sigma B factor antagonist